MKHSSPNQARTTYVLVEEEKAIRDEWLRISDAKNILLMTYPDGNWFLSDLLRGIFRGDERFYLDQDFGKERGVGMRLSSEIKRIFPGAYTSLVTAYPRFMFHKEIAAGQVNDVFGKYPSPFDNPPHTEFEEKFNRQVWHGLLSLAPEFN